MHVIIVSVDISFGADTIQIKPTEQYFPVLQFITFYRVVLLFWARFAWIKNYSVIIQMNVIKQYLHLVPFIMLYKVALSLNLWIQF